MYWTLPFGFAWIKDALLLLLCSKTLLSSFEKRWRLGISYTSTNKIWRYDYNKLSWWIRLTFVAQKAPQQRSKSASWHLDTVCIWYLDSYFQIVHWKLQEKSSIFNLFCSISTKIELDFVMILRCFFIFDFRYFCGAPSGGCRRHFLTKISVFWIFH